ncbi:hypothetical protein SAMN05421753_101525 [Planctomicrobium piriforme]|uniref:Uncharacterized protein n=2 Tax=Planctomicrobium piriforme TaxID=1576369 RepID=A0A1I3BLT2_9PLAN|nr:hypothetical protein SAMN05421753_101525 [Planctomicrobium piriforme]
MNLCRNREGEIEKIVFWAAMLALCIGILIYITTKPLTPPKVAELPPDVEPEKNSHSRHQKLLAFYQANVDPLIAASNNSNQEAAERCLAHTKAIFERSRMGIEPFFNDITSWSTRASVIWKVPSDWWYRRQAVQQMIEAKLEKHIFSDESLQKELTEVLDLFRDDINVNRAKLIADIKAAVSLSDLPDLPTIDVEEFVADQDASLKSYSADFAVDNVQNAVIIEITSTAGGFAAEQLLAAIGTRLGAMVIAASGAAGGATVGGAAAGGGGGSAAGPVGTVVGLAGGLLVGVVIDWWMTKSFHDKICADLDKMINEAEKAVILGTDNLHGLKGALDSTCKTINHSCQDILKNKIVQANTK